MKTVPFKLSGTGLHGTAFILCGFCPAIIKCLGF
jgi:hypothetical protein